MLHPSARALLDLIAGSGLPATHTLSPEAARRMYRERRAFTQPAAPEVAQKYRLQASADVGVLLAGRSESLISLKAYADAPILGHGSWAQDKASYLDDYISLRYRYGITEENKVEDDSPLIPAHSYLIGAMVWGGIVGGLFWVLFSWRIARIYLTAASALPLYFHVGMVTFLWNLLFSPFGAAARWELAIFFAVLVAYTQQKNLESR